MRRVARRELQAFGGELVEVRRLHVLAAVAREVAVAEVVGEHEHDVRPLGVGSGDKTEAEQRRLGRVLMDVTDDSDTNATPRRCNTSPTLHIPFGIHVSSLLTSAFALELTGMPQASKKAPRFLFTIFE